MCESSEVEKVLKKWEIKSSGEHLNGDKFERRVEMTSKAAATALGAKPKPASQKLIQKQVEQAVRALLAFHGKQSSVLR